MTLFRALEGKDIGRYSLFMLDCNMEASLRKYRCGN
jgi:hypothetical protein